MSGDNEIDEDHEEYEADQASLTEGQLQEVLIGYVEALTKANTTIVNLLRKDPLLYLEVAEAAVVKEIAKERETWERENARMKDKLKAMRYLVGKARTEGWSAEKILSALEPVLGSGR